MASFFDKFFYADVGDLDAGRLATRIAQKVKVIRKINYSYSIVLHRLTIYSKS